MRVCLLNRYFDFRGTGVTRIAVEVAKELHQQGHEVVQVATDGDSLYSYAYQTAVGTILRLPRKNVDVYHALATLESMWLPRDKSIATFLDLFTTTNPRRAGAGMGYSPWKLAVGKQYFKLGCQLAARCRFLVCISNKTKQDVIEHVRPDESKLRVIRLGIRDDLTPRKDGHSRFTIGTLGQLDKRKRIDVLVRQFKASRIDADLLIAGNGPDRDLLQAMAGDDPRIRFLGLIPDEDLARFYNRIDLFCFPTAIEGYGLPAVESMACGKPVMVMSDVIMPYEIQSRCAVVDDYTGAFNDYSMERVLKSVDYDGNLRFAQEHRWSTCVAQYVDLYEEIVKEAK